MKKLFKNEMSAKNRSFLLTCFLLLLIHTGFSQQTATVLPNNASNSGKSSPQGALRYQRLFYLVTPAEMGRSGVTTGMNINSLGFTLSRAQGDTTKGNIKIYLQNTTDLVSRADTAWNTVTTATNQYSINGIFPGNYEWQVRANCTGNSAFSNIIAFSNDELGGCNIPYNLTTGSVTTTTATLSWESANSSAFASYKLEYQASGNAAWTQVTTTDTFYNLTALQAGTSYQWRVRTLCTTDSSAINSASFETNSASNCNAPSALSATATMDTVLLSWTAAAGASYYDVQFRRAGTNSWSSTASFSNSASLVLPGGTTYEWRVRTICVPGPSGDYVAGTNFITGGTTVCYEPTNPYTTQITDSSASFRWTAVQGATGYTLRYRLKNTISWTNATTPMTLVSDSLFILPATTGGYDIPFVRGSSFTYNGGGVYVAVEYSRPAGNLPSPNLTLTTTSGTSIPGASGQDSLKFLLSMVSRADTGLTSLPSILAETEHRPETRFGSSSLKDSVAVIAVHALGNTIPRFQSPTPVSALISNLGTTNKTYTVTLTVKEKTTGAVRHTSTKDLAVSANDTALVSFTGWSPVISETDSIIVSVPAQADENVTNNNSKAYLQHVNSLLLGYDDGSPLVTEAGTGTSGGLLLNKHSVKSCAKVIAAKVYLAESSKNKSIQAVVLNSSGTIVTESSLFTPTANDVNGYHSFYFDSAASFSNEDFYIGIRQPASATAFSPVGSQWEDAVTRAGAYYKANSDGTGLVDSPQLGRLMILAEINSSAPEVTVSGNLILCSGATNTLTAGSSNSRFANRVINVSSQNYNTSVKILGSPDVYPAYGLSSNTWLTATGDGQREFITVGFPDPSPINYVDIYETSGTGAVDSVFAKNPLTNTYDLVYSSTATAGPATARKKRISFTQTTYNVSEIRIAVNSPAVSGFNTIDAVGIGSSVSPGSFSTFLWSPGGETTATKSVSAAGAYKVTVTDASGCSSSDSVEVVTSESTLPVITANTSTALCEGDSVTLTSSQPTGIRWSNGETTPSITVFNAGSYTVKYNSGSGCDSLTSAPYVVTVNPLPVTSITGSLDICIGNSNSLSAGAGFSIYRWSTGETTPSISVGDAGVYTVIVTNSIGCRDTASATTQFVTLAAPTVTGNLSFCPGGSTTLDAGTGYASYVWSTGSTDRYATISNAGDVTVTVTNANGCSASRTVNVSIFAAPVPEISGNDGFCAGGSTTLTATAGFASYLWSTNAATASINVSSIGSYVVTVTDGNGCTGTATQAVSVYPNPVPVISGTLSFCGGTNTQLNAGSGYLSYLWSTGATTQTVNVNTAGSISVTVTNLNGCTASATVTTTRTGAIPAVPGVISGATSASCGTTGNIYTIAAVANTSHYVWTVPTGVTIASGQGTTSVSLNFASNFTGGYISVAASNACGQSPSLVPRRLFIQTLTNAPGNITGQVASVCGPTTKTYSIAAVTGATSYTWTVPAGVTITSGQSTRTINVSFAANYTFGNICVTANNACGSTVAKCVEVSGVPPTPGQISGSQVLCSGQQNVSYSVDAVPGATTYEWTVPQSASVVFGQGTRNVIVNFGPAAGNVSVIAKSTCGSSSASTIPVSLVTCLMNGLMSNTITLHERRPVPEIISSYGGFSRSQSMSLEYTMGEPRIETVNRNTLLFTEGFHQPLVYVMNVKTKDSTVLITTDLKVIAYPNPVTSILRVKVESAVARGLMLDLRDVAGRSLQRRTIQSDQGLSEFRMEQYSGGTYYLVVSGMDGKLINTIKIVKGN